MELIDLYVSEVGRRLPRRGRSDIEAELRSTLQDMLEDRSRKAGHAVDDDMILDVLREYGPPDKIAATYEAHPYLIGPRLFPFFSRVLKIVVTVLVVVQAVTLGIQLGSQALAGAEAARAIGEGLLGIVGAVIAAFGNVALVFAILERFVPASEFKWDEETKAWDPASLRKLAEPETIHPWEPIAAIVMIAAAMALFNGYPELIGIHFLRDGAWVHVPVLTAAFFRWMPLINVIWALQLAMNVVLLRQGRWEALTKWSSIGFKIAGFVVAYLLLSGPPIVAVSAQTLLGMGAFDPAAAATLSQQLPNLARLVLVIVLIAHGADLVKETIRLLRGVR